MPNKIKCRECEYKVITRINRRRGVCDCSHPEARQRAPYDMRSYRDNVRVGYTEDYSDVPKMRTAPRWCPIKAGEEPK